ncbi:hypothetical protein KBB74_02635 [Candidatus Parcubacteria bacterium]|nr:hypothetical protein [Candidatus Parcubacteria bacterium]
MAKLLFETDDGQVREINLNTIKTKSITENDVIIAGYEIGDIAEDKNNLVAAELVRLKTMLEQAFPKTKILVTAMRHGKEDVSIRIVKDKE